MRIIDNIEVHTKVEKIAKKEHIINIEYAPLEKPRLLKDEAGRIQKIPGGWLSKPSSILSKTLERYDLLFGPNLYKSKKWKTQKEAVRYNLTIFIKGYWLLQNAPIFLHRWFWLNELYSFKKENWEIKKKETLYTLELKGSHPLLYPLAMGTSFEHLKAFQDSEHEGDFDKRIVRDILYLHLYDGTVTDEASLRGFLYQRELRDKNPFLVSCLVRHLKILKEEMLAEYCISHMTEPEVKYLLDQSA